MGKFGIGARVRTRFNSEVIIVGKRKGERLIRFNDGPTRWRLKSDLTPLPVKLEVGRYYRSRDGRKYGPMRMALAGGWQWSDGCLTWTRSGTWRSGFTKNGEDLIAEWVDTAPEKPAQPAPESTTTTYKVGDRVDFTDACLKGWWFGPNTKNKSGVIVETGLARYEYAVLVDGVSRRGNVNDCHIRTAVEIAPTPTESHIVCRMTKSGQPRPSRAPVVHSSLTKAEAEAQRLADKFGDDFAVYSRGETKSVDAGPCPNVCDWGYLRAAIESPSYVAFAFDWEGTKQGHNFWLIYYNDKNLAGQAILKKWLADYEVAKAKNAAADERAKMATAPF